MDAALKWCSTPPLWHTEAVWDDPISSCSGPFLQERFSKAGSYYCWLARGVDHRPVRPAGPGSLLAPMKAALQPIIDEVWQYCGQTGVRGRKVTLKVKFSEFQQISRSRTLMRTVDIRSQLEEIATGLLVSILPVARPVRLLGVSLSTLNTDEEQQSPQTTLGI
ncbi:DinB/UmuC family translesion DNA polymerase [Microvirga roseola]|uniref:DinB/UmuC family translesion DNA polymerase n=1 Tax=Microvirga roseola TaxID=2883126 RepID=UPI0038993FE8